MFPLLKTLQLALFSFKLGLVDLVLIWLLKISLSQVHLSKGFFHCFWQPSAFHYYYTKGWLYLERMHQCLHDYFTHTCMYIYNLFQKSEVVSYNFIFSCFQSVNVNSFHACDLFKITTYVQNPLQLLNIGLLIVAYKDFFLIRHTKSLLWTVHLAHVKQTYLMFLFCCYNTVEPSVRNHPKCQA